ncbi:N-acetylmuramoyl-L-alanine amidase [Nocardia bovistercoris]|uniref:N-acetylmuramoyl-L-alanine amidase n=1 Tax=Nocardia bovistercoris TaxID=2785916 RepID=A0A931ICP6_9NOCA|nr:N-acetylmuramoyl-L-alanine amidase [Nocardia bovistercoris]MBH0778989.1 N-acetylmuramoyl-L-alanine amidase [Nocardia bovistercoris]
METLVPYRKPKYSYVLPMVTSLAVAAPLATLTLGDSTGYPSVANSELAAVPAQLAEVVLDSAPEITLPVRDLTGLDLPDLRLSDLRVLPDHPPSPPGPAPSPTTEQPGQTSSAPRSGGLRFVSDPADLEPGTTPDTPALTPGAVPAELLGQVGAQVKQLSRDTPFSVVALTARELANTTAMVRARQPDGGWGPWYQTEPVDTRRDDHVAADRTSGTEPIYVGNTNSVQILVTRKDAASAPKAPPAPGAVPGPDPLEQPPARAGDPAPVVTDLTAILIDPGRGAIDGALNDVAGALPGGGPGVITRAQWGADESLRCEDPTYDDALGGVTVHHTAGRNDYGKAESAGIVRAIYTYHARTLGWCDIGYNALVDKYGQIFEGRAGGLDRPVQGAHAGGFNENTAGVALMGNHETETPSDAAVNAVGAFVGWRTRVAGLDPRGHTTMYSEGTEFTPYAQGESVDLPIVFAHRDVGNTTCPGDAAYELMDRIRDIAAGTPGRPSPGRSQADLAALAALTARLLEMVDDNVIARHWSNKGGPDGPLGAAISEPLPAASGAQFAKFANGYVYSTPDGRTVEVVGEILQRFLNMGADSGILGLPLSDAYPVPDGVRADFQHGSLILNQLTGVVTTVWKTYNETYQQEMRRDPATTPTPPPAHVGPTARTSITPPVTSPRPTPITPPTHE